MRMLNCVNGVVTNGYHTRREFSACFDIEN